jgi:glycosyltransferase involved in cell wall biosynthesis
MSGGPITYFGILRGHTSWGKVGREMVRALVDLGADVNIYERKGFLFDPSYELPDAVTRRITQTFRDDAVFTFEHPNVYKYLSGRLKIGMLTYESTVAPPHWVENVNRHLDRLLVPSRFCRDLFEAGGIPGDRIVVLPYGFSPRVFTAEGPARDFPDEASAGWRFLTVACPHKRKGIETVLEAYRRAFCPGDDVSLTVKLNYLPGKKAKPFELRDIEALLDGFARDPGTPRLAVIADYLSEAGLAALYRGASCLVSATRGEGFGMVYLEALACGLPVIVTGWSGHLDFLDDETARLVRYRLRPAAEIQYDCESPEALVAEPDVDDLARAMREAYKGRHRPTKKASPEHLERFTWPHIAKRFLSLVKSWADTPKEKRSDPELILSGGRSTESTE